MTAEEYFKTHGITSESIKKFGILFNKEKISIPITEGENVVFNKYRHLNGDKSKFSYDEGSHATLFNAQILEESTYVFLTEGEFDCIRLDQEGLPAITNTSGASTFKEEWIAQLEGKKVYIVYDNDRAGHEGAIKVKEKLPQALIINLPDGIKDICDYFQQYSISDFKKMVKDQIKANTLTYKQLCDIFDKWLLLPDKNVIRILLATLISHFFATDPLWMFFVAPPSGSKTEIISTIAFLPFCHLLSDLTAQTLASGMPTKKDHDPSLLMKLKNNVLIMKDFTTVLSMRHEDKMQILAQLREVYDGRYSKSFGTGKRVEWEGRLTLIAGVTSIIDTHSSIFQVMGERFVMYRVPQANDEDVADKALSNYGGEKEMREELRIAMQKYFLSITIPPASDIELPMDIRKALGSTASFIVKARSGLIRDNFKKELIYIPETEAPSRLAKQLGTLIKALAVLEGRKTVNWEDYFMTLRVALDVVPANRMRHLIALCGQDFMSSTTEIAQKTEYSRSGTELILEDLTALGLVKVERYGSGSPNEWGISQRTMEYFKKMVPNKSVEMDEMFPETSHYFPLIQQMLTGKISQEIERDEIDKQLMSPID